MSENRIESFSYPEEDEFENLGIALHDRGDDCIEIICADTEQWTSLYIDDKEQVKQMIDWLQRWVDKNNS